MRAGDLLLIEGVETRVTARTEGQYWIDGALAHGVAIDWRAEAGSARGVIFRWGTDVLGRIAPAR